MSKEPFTDVKASPKTIEKIICPYCNKPMHWGKYTKKYYCDCTQVIDVQSYQKLKAENERLLSIDHKQVEEIKRLRKAIEEAISEVNKHHDPTWLEEGNHCEHERLLKILGEASSQEGSKEAGK